MAEETTDVIIFFGDETPFSREVYQLTKEQWDAALLAIVYPHAETDHLDESSIDVLLRKARELIDELGFPGEWITLSPKIRELAETWKKITDVDAYFV